MVEFLTVLEGQYIDMISILTSGWVLQSQVLHSTPFLRVPHAGSVLAFQRPPRAQLAAATLHTPTKE